MGEKKGVFCPLTLSALQSQEFIKNGEGTKMDKLRTKG